LFSDVIHRSDSALQHTQACCPCRFPSVTGVRRDLRLLLVQAPVERRSDRRALPLANDPKARPIAIIGTSRYGQTHDECSGASPRPSCSRLSRRGRGACFARSERSGRTTARDSRIDGPRWCPGRPGDVEWRPPAAPRTNRPEIRGRLPGHCEERHPHRHNSEDDSQGFYGPPVTRAVHAAWYRGLLPPGQRNGPARAYDAPHTEVQHPLSFTQGR
jgi:hypothetical protein